jgi:hypothetical protein
MRVDLRPLSLGELLDRTFTYYREQFWTFVGIMVPAEIVIVATGLLLLALGLGPTMGLGTRPVTPSQQIAAFGMLFATVSISLLISLLARSIALGATSFAVSKIHLGSRTTIGEAYRSLKGSVGRVIGLYGLYILIVIAVYLMVIAGVLLVAGLGALVVPLASMSGGPVAGILIGLLVVLAAIGAIVVAAIVCVRYSLAVPALVLEKLGPVKALTRSSALAKGRLKQIFLACLLMSLIAAVISMSIETPFWVVGVLLGFKFGHNPLWLAAPATIAGGFGGALGYPFLTIVLTLFYYDSRVRMEGYDLQVMMSSIGPAPEMPPGPTEKPEFAPDAKLVSVRSFRGPTASLEAELARNVLKEEGIPSVSPPDMQREVIPRIDVVQLLVCEEDAARAGAILEAFQNADAELLESDSSESSETRGPDSQTSGSPLG